MWDGNMVGAVVGPDPVESVSAYAETVHDTLKDLADNLVKEAVRVEIPHERITLPEIRPAENTTLQSNFVELYRLNETQVCAVIKPAASVVGISRLGNSVHGAIRDLATQLVEKFVWVEVTMRALWQVTDVDSLLNGEPPRADDDEN